jgi:hypothetical protein
MKRTADAAVAPMLLLASAISLAQEPPSVLPTGLGEEIDVAVERLRSATAEFRVIDNARAAGYAQETQCVERPPEGGMGYHFTKAELRDGAVEFEKPEVLVYGKLADGSFKLNGVEYIVPIESWRHAEPPTVMGQPLKRFDRGGFWYLHVWIWEPSPSGLFADWNPRVKCPTQNS